MRQLLPALFLLSTAFFFVAAYSANDTECVDDLRALITCFREKHEKNEADDMKKLSKVESRIKKCFSDNKCEEPDLDGEPFKNATGILKEVVEHAKKSWAHTPDKVKQCFKQSAGKLLIEKANECLKKKKVDQLNVYEYQLLASFKQFSPDNKTEGDKLFKWVVNILDSLVQCHKKKGGHATNATVQCLEPIKDDIKEEICDRLKSCEKDKVSDSCRKRGKEVEKALCECQLDKLKSLDKDIEKFDDGKDHKLVDLNKNVINRELKKEWDEFTGHIKQCFNESNVEIPEVVDGIGGILLLHGAHPFGPRAILPFAVLALGTIAKQSAGEMIATSEQIGFFHGVVHEMIEHHECGCN